MSNYRTEDVERLAEVFKCLGNRHRLRILIELAACCKPDAACCGGAGSRRVGELAEGQELAASTVSHHIKELNRAGLMCCAKHGKQTLCCVDQGVLAELREFFNGLAR